MINKLALIVQWPLAIRKRCIVTVLPKMNARKVNATLRLDVDDYAAALSLKQIGRRALYEKKATLEVSHKQRR